MKDEIKAGDLVVIKGSPERVTWVVGAIYPDGGLYPELHCNIFRERNQSEPPFPAVVTATLPLVCLELLRKSDDAEGK